MMEWEANFPPAKSLKAIKDAACLKSIVLILRERSLTQLQINAACCLSIMAEKSGEHQVNGLFSSQEVSLV